MTPALNSNAPIGCPAISQGTPVYRLEMIASDENNSCHDDATGALLAFYTLFSNHPNYKTCGLDIKLYALLASAAIDGKVCAELSSDKLESCFISTMIKYSALKLQGDLKSAFILAKKTADSNDVTGYSQMYLGTMYYYGEGTTRDPKMAIEWFKVALEKMEDKQFRIFILMSLAIAHEDMHDNKNAINYLQQCASMGDRHCKNGLKRRMMSK